MPADPTELDGGLWLPVSEIAERLGVGKSTISEKVKALESEGRIATKPGKGRQKLINLAQYLTAVGKTGDAVKELAFEQRAEPDTPAAPDAPPEAARLRDAQTRRAMFDADLKEIELKEKLGALIPVADVQEAQQRAAEAIVRIVERLPTFAEEIAVAVGKDGANGARATLKKIRRDLRQAIADALTAVADAADAAAEATRATEIPA